MSLDNLLDSRRNIIQDPFQESDSLDWLELKRIPTIIRNPLYYPVGSKLPDPTEELLNLFLNTDYIHFAAKMILNVNLLPFQCVIIDTLWRRRLPMLIASRGGSKCIVGNSLCQTSNGLLRMDEIIDKNSPVMQRIPINFEAKGQNNFNKIEYGWNNGYSETIKITTSFGYEIEGTKNHPIKVLSKNGDLVWKELQNIDNTDIIPINREGYNFGKNKNIDLDFAWWLGATVGDGMTCQKRYINFTNIDKDIYDLWIRIGEKLSNVKATNPPSNPDSFFLYSTEFNKYINENIGLQYKKAHGKSIPKCIRESDKFVVGQFLSGLFDTDGYCDKEDIGFSTVSDQLSIQVQSCLLAFGIICKRSYYLAKCNGEYFPAYSVIITGKENCLLFNKYIGFKCERKQIKLEKLCVRKSNPNKDLIPQNFKQIILDLVSFYKQKYQISVGHGYNYTRQLLMPSRIKSYNMSFETLGKVLDITSRISDHSCWIQLKEIHNNHLLYDKINKIENLYNQTFDVHIPEDHSFIANGFINHNSFCLGVYCLLRMVLNPGCKIVIVGAGLRQARNVFDYMATIWASAPVLQDISGKSKTAGPRREVDRFQFECGDSNCYAIPMGQGDKIRGLRANIIISDETPLIPESIFNIVVQGFAVVAKDPISKVKEAALINKLRRDGEWDEKMEEMRNKSAEGNQICFAGSAYYSFNHFAKRFKEWRAIIATKGDPKKLKQIFGDEFSLVKGFNWTDYACIRIPYTALPEGMLDQGIISQARITLSPQQFNMEMGACFSSDSDGFYRRSILEATTTNKPVQINSGELIQFNALRQGDETKRYVIGVDPAADRDNAAIIVLEIYPDHRRIVYCWTTNRKKYVELKKYNDKRGVELEEDYYRYIAKKIRILMRLFNTEHIIMDKHGGGIAISEALSSRETCEKGEDPVYEIIEEGKEKYTDFKDGAHILQLMAATQDINSEANHGMLKDFQDKVLLFPMFNTVELAKSIELDNINKIEFDTFEDLLNEIEELKNEITTVVATPSANIGKETFDTPSIKGENEKRGRLRKDRYSALLYANYYARNKDKNQPVNIEYKAVGGTKESFSTKKNTAPEHAPMYYGPGAMKWAKSGWMNGKTIPKYLNRGGRQN